MTEDEQQQPARKFKSPAYEKQLLALILCDPEFFDLNARALKPSSFDSEFGRLSMERVCELVEKYGQPPSLRPRRAA